MGKRARDKNTDDQENQPTKKSRQKRPESVEERAARKKEEKRIQHEGKKGHSSSTAAPSSPPSSRNHQNRSGTSRVYAGAGPSNSSLPKEQASQYSETKLALTTHSARFQDLESFKARAVDEISYFHLHLEEVQELNLPKSLDWIEDTLGSNRPAGDSVQQSCCFVEATRHRRDCPCCFREQRSA